MKNLLSFEKFFESKITSNDLDTLKTHSGKSYQSVRDFINKHKDDSTIWNDVFNGRNRIYFDMQGNELNKRDLIKNSNNTVLNLKDISDLDKIENFTQIQYNDETILKRIIYELLSSLGFEFIDYENNSCSKDKNGAKNKTTITAILSRKNLPKKYTKIDLLNKYNQRHNKSIFNKVVDISSDKKKADKMIVFSIHPVDLLAMSQSREWEQYSCMRLSTSNSTYIFNDMRNGSVVCYQTDIDDFNINKPNARLLFKPYINITDEDSVILYGGDRVYGNSIDNFDDVALNIVNDTFNSGEDGVYELQCSLYNDEQPNRIEKSGDYIEASDEEINLGNFFDIYDPETMANKETFNILYDEFKSNGGVIDTYHINGFDTLFDDLSREDKIELAYRYMEVIEELFLEGEPDNNYEDNYLPNLMSIYEELDTDDARILLGLSAQILGEKFIFDKLDEFIQNIFEFKYEKFKRDYDDTYTKTIEFYENVYKNKAFQEEYEAHKEFYDNLPSKEGIDADHGDCKIVKTEFFNISIYKKCKFINNKFQIFVAIDDKKRGTYKTGYITKDSLKNDMYNAGTIV